MTGLTLCRSSSLVPNYAPQRPAIRQTSTPHPHPVNTGPFVRWCDRSWRCRVSEDPDEIPPFLDPRIKTAKGAAAVGALGSLALLLGWMLQLDPFGNLHFDLNHILIGVECSVPVIAMMMAAFWINPPSPVANMSLKQDADGIARLKPLENKTSRKQIDLLYDGIGFYQQSMVQKRMMSNDMGPHFDIFWFAGVLPAEMLKRALLLTAVGNWFRDRTYEAGINELITPVDLTVDDVGKWCALSCFVGFALAGILFNASRKPSKPDDTILQLNEKLQKFFEQTMHAELDSTSMGRMFKSIRAGRRVAEVIESVIYLSSQMAAAGAYILTGNLASSITVTVLMRVTAMGLTEPKLPKSIQLPSMPPPGSLQNKPFTEFMKQEHYRNMKEDFHERLVKEEARQKIDQADIKDAPQQTSKINETVEDKVQRLLDHGVGLELYAKIFRVTCAQLTEEINSDKLKEFERKLLEAEKEEVDALLTRYSAIEDKLDKKTLKLNFHRDPKDRYKGGKK